MSRDLCSFVLYGLTFVPLYLLVSAGMELIVPCCSNNPRSGCQEMIADSRSDLECARLLTLSCASAIDNLGANKARDQIAMIKYTVPELAFRVIDRSVQVCVHCRISYFSTKPALGD